jgi:1-acyl-sn-glycerol-3-phosphate acyltransferase
MALGIFRIDYHLKSRPTPALYYFFRFLFRMFFVIYFRREVHGKKYLSKKGGGVLTCNHSSFLDPPLGGESWPRPIYYLARRTLFRSWLGRIFMNATQSVPIRRGENDHRAIRRAVAVIDEGHIISLFPEGTRSEDGKLQPGRPGAGMIAYKAKARIYPCYIDGSWRSWSRKSKQIRPVKIHVYYGPSFYPRALYQKRSSKAVYREISNLMMKHISRLKTKAHRYTHMKTRIKKRKRVIRKA